MSPLPDASDDHSGSGCALLVPLKPWCRRAPQELIAAQFPLDRIVDVDGVLHLRLPVEACSGNPPDPTTEQQAIEWARRDLRLGRELTRQKRTRRNPEPPVAA